MNNLIDEKEIQEKLEQIFNEELERYKRERKIFYSKPINWSNNKRKRYGLPVLRGVINRNREKKYRRFHPIDQFPILFHTLEESIDNILQNQYDHFFDSFVDFKDVNLGDKNVFV